MNYPTLSDIEIRWRTSGSGICIIVEGENEQADPWFYKQWFGDRSRELTFFPQDGWEKVAQAVIELRERGVIKKVYGIADRDFEAYIGIDEPFPQDGLLRTRKYTLENYQLDASCWFNWARQFTERQPWEGWHTVEEVQTHIETLYQECLILSAYNWTLYQAKKLNSEAFMGLPQKEREYSKHPKALKDRDVVEQLRIIQAKVTSDDDWGQIYTDQLHYLRTLSFTQLEEVVSGKYVLNLLHERFPLKISGKQAWDDILAAYMYHCPTPPDDLEDLVERILQDARS